MRIARTAINFVAGVLVKITPERLVSSATKENSDKLFTASKSNFLNIFKNYTHFTPTIVK